MRRRYAFEAEGISEEVKAQLEKVEEVVDDKCTDADACNKMLEKIEAEEDKFNDALQSMADSARDAKDGKIDTSEMASQISPKMAELKEVAKSIGVATESDTLSESELQDAKAYLEGAKEIVEAKLDEVGGDGKKDGTCPDCGKDPCECGASEGFGAMDIFDADGAMEGILSRFKAAGALRNGMTAEQAERGIKMLCEKRNKTVDMERADEVRNAVEEFNSNLDSENEEESASKAEFHSGEGVCFAIFMKKGRLSEVQVPIVGSQKLVKFSIREIAAEIAKQDDRAETAARKEAKKAERDAKKAAKNGEAPAEDGGEEGAAESALYFDIAALEAESYFAEDDEAMESIVSRFKDAHDQNKNGSTLAQIKTGVEDAAHGQLDTSDEGAQKVKAAAAAYNQKVSDKKMVVKKIDDATVALLLEKSSGKLVKVYYPINGTDKLGSVGQRTISANSAKVTGRQQEAEQRAARKEEREAKKAEKAAAKAAKNGDASDEGEAASESALNFEGFASACESAMVKGRGYTMPYLFD